MPVALPDLFEAISGEAHVALAVSGGSDSMGMLRLAHQWSGARGDAPKLSVLTVDHGLRAASAAEAAQVAKWSGAIGLSHHTLTWTGSKPTTGLQAKARQARYDLMTAWCQTHGAQVLLTAHTLDDQAETVLMRLARTASIDSLAGIAPIGHWGGLKLVRPLLGARRDEIRALLQAAGQAWIEDPSNRDEQFERVRVRRSLAGLDQSGITAGTLAQLADECREAAEVMGGLAHDFLRSQLTGHPQGYGTIPLAPFRSLHPAIRLRVLRRVIPYFGAGTTPLRSEIARTVDELATPGTRRTLGGAVLWVRATEILVARESGRISADPVPVPDSGSVFWDGRFLVTAPPGTSVLPARLFPGLPRAEGLPHLVKEAEPAIRLASGEVESVVYVASSPLWARFNPIRVL